MKSAFLWGREASSPTPGFCFILARRRQVTTSLATPSFVPELHAFGDRAPAKDRRMAAIFKRVFFIAPALNEPIIFFSAASIRFQQDCPIVSLDAALHATGCF